MSHTPEPWEANRFTDVNGNQHDSNLAVADTLKHSAMQSESAELFGASQGDLVVFYTGNGPRSKRNAMRAVECVNACAGLADPAKEIAEMREALKEAEKSFKMIDACEPDFTSPELFYRNAKDHCLNALAKIEALNRWEE